VFKNLINNFKVFGTRIFSTYLAVGAATFIAYYFFVWVQFDYLKINYLTSISISYFLATSLHFFTNRKLTFNISGKQYYSQIIRYVSVAAVNYIIQICIVKITHRFIGLNLYISLLISIAATTAIGFILLNYWVFRSVNDNSSQSA